MFSQPSGLNSSFSGNAGQQKVYDYRKGAILPCTIFQLNNFISSQEDGLYGFEASHMLLGVVRRLDRTPTSVDFELDDSTGVTACKIYGETDGLEQGNYVRVIGKWDFSKKSLTVYKAITLTTYNEITHHILNVLSVYRSNTSTSTVSGGQAAQTNMQLDEDPELQGLDTGALSEIPGSIAVVKFLKQNNTDTGCLVDDIAKGCNMDLTIVRPILQQLESRAICYTTTDDDRFALAS